MAISFVDHIAQHHLALLEAMLLVFPLLFFGDFLVHPLLVLLEPLACRIFLRNGLALPEK